MVKLKDEDIIEAAKNAESIADCLRKLNLAPNESRYRMMKSHFTRLNIDTSHFLTASELLKKYPIKRVTQLSNEEVFTEKSQYYCNKTLKNKLLKLGIENKCSECGIDNWRDKPISLELDHINGDSTDNRMENLRILCPNCHSQTPTFRARKRNSPPDKKCLDCQCLIKQRTTRCKKCASENSKLKISDTLIKVVSKKQSKLLKANLDLEKTMQEIVDTSILSVARKYDVSDNALKKFLMRRIPNFKQILEENGKLRKKSTDS